MIMIYGPALLETTLGRGRTSNRNSARHLSPYNDSNDTYRYFMKFENYVPNSMPGVDLSLKGRRGPVKTGYFTHITKSSTDFVEACINMNIPFNSDFNTSNQSIGVNRVRFDILLLATPLNMWRSRLVSAVSG